MSASPENPMTEDQFKFAMASLEDNRRLIAAGKSQRWDVIKWAIALNVALATASTAIPQPTAALTIFVFTMINSLIAEMLVFYYTKRVTGARNNSVTVYNYLTRNNIDCAEISGKDTMTDRDWRHDFGELMLFGSILLLSSVPSLIAWVLKN
jgi:hypothetical protein